MKYFIILLMILLSGCTPPIGSDLEEQILGAKEIRLDKISAIVDTIEIDGKMKEIKEADKDIVGESFIHKVDYPKYQTWGGDIAIFGSITLVDGEDQYADTFMSPPEGMFVRSIQKLVGSNNIITFREIATTTNGSNLEQIITKTSIWEDIEFNDNFEIDKSIERKDIFNMKEDRAFRDYFEVGKTNVYRLVVRVPLSAVGGKWIWETIGENGEYGHLDPNLWIYEQKFNDLNTADLIGQDSWAGSTSYDVQASVVYEGAKAVSQDRSSDTQVARTITEVISGTVYISIRETDVSITSGGCIILGDNDVGNTTYVRISGGYIKVYTSGAWTSTGLAVSNNTWYRLGIAFETGSGAWEGLSADTFKVNIDDGSWTSAYSFHIAITNIDTIRLASANSGGSGTVYYDFISPNYEDVVPVAADIQQTEIYW